MNDVDAPVTWPWDTWLIRARERGVPDELARLARDVLRDHAQHRREGDWIGGDPEYLLELCLAAPMTAEHDCFEALAWWNSKEDGAVVAFVHLATMLGSDDAADAALEREKPTVDRLRAEAGQNSH
jgi:hypothetical protein